MKTLNLLTALIAMLAANPVLAGDLATPEKVTVCAACHGTDGKATVPIYPHLAGQYSNYLELTLREYRSGVRKSPVMGPQASSLSDAEIRQLAAYYAAQPGPLYTPGIHSGAKK